MYSQSTQQEQSCNNCFFGPLQFQVPDDIQWQAQNDKIEDQIGHQDGRHESLDRKAFMGVHSIRQYPHVRHRMTVEQDTNGRR